MIVWKILLKLAINVELRRFWPNTINVNREHLEYMGIVNYARKQFGTNGIVKIVNEQFHIVTYRR